jgi:hypothetical protein
MLQYMYGGGSMERAESSTPRRVTVTKDDTAT